MERKDFLLKSCALCGCTGIALFTGRSVKAASGEEKEDWRVGFMQKRFSHLVDFMQTDLDEDTRHKLIEEMGRYCSGMAADSYKKFSGNLEAFLKDLESGFMEKCEYDKESEVIKMTGRKQESCSCAFAGKNKIHGEFCNCSKGWMRETIRAITGRDSLIMIDSTLLRGGDRCSFTVKFI